MYSAVSNGGFDVVFEAVGSSAAMAAALDAVKPGGKIVTVGNSIEPTIEIDINRLVLRETHLIGSVSCTRKELSETIELIANGMIDPDRYITDIVGLEDLQHAFERLTSKTDPVVKIVMKPTLRRNTTTTEKKTAVVTERRGFLKFVVAVLSIAAATVQHARYWQEWVVLISGTTKL